MGFMPSINMNDIKISLSSEVFTAQDLLVAMEIGHEEGYKDAWCDIAGVISVAIVVVTIFMILFI